MAAMVAAVATLFLAWDTPAVESGDSIEAVAGESVQHVLRPGGKGDLPANARIAIPPALIRDARVHVPTAAAPIVTFPAPAPAHEFIAYPGRAPPRVIPRKQSLVFYPCSRCHKNLKTNPTQRVLMPAHEVGLKHGAGRLWCLNCHDAGDHDRLQSVRGTPVDYDESWRVCGQCHQARQKDWYYGAHGKRYYSWKGEPVRYNCTHCHNPHRPPFMRRKPQPPPPVRAGLEPMPRPVRLSEPLWKKHADRLIGVIGND